MVPVRASAVKLTLLAEGVLLEGDERSDEPAQRAAEAMRKVFASRDLLLLGHLRNVLATEGIAAVMRNLHLGTAAGELPLIECWPELWVVDDAEDDRARAILDRAMHAPPARAASWRCSGCGERHEGQFSDCWKCGRPAALGEV